MLGDLPSGKGLGLSIQVNPRFRESLVKATELYSEARAESLDALYKNLRVMAGSRDQKQEWTADVEEVAGCCGYFSYCLQEFSEEMVTFLDILERMEDYQNNITRSWDWLKIWRRLGSGRSNDNEGNLPVHKQYQGGHN